MLSVFRLPPGTQLAVVVGADRAMSKSGKTKWTRRIFPRDAMLVCVGRQGDTEAVVAAANESTRKASMEDAGADADADRPQFIMIEQEVAPLSSTLARQQLNRLLEATTPEQKETTTRELQSDCVLSAPVLQYFLTHMHEPDFFLPPKPKHQFLKKGGRQKQTHSASAADD